MQLTKINYQTENEVIPVVAQDGHAWVTIPQIAQILEVSESYPAKSSRIIGGFQKKATSGKFDPSSPRRRTNRNAKCQSLFR